VKPPRGKPRGILAKETKNLDEFLTYVLNISPDTYPLKLLKVGFKLSASVRRFMKIQIDPNNNRFREISHENS
jgi:hypothetical protein